MNKEIEDAIKREEAQEKNQGTRAEADELAIKSTEHDVHLKHGTN